MKSRKTLLIVIGIIAAVLIVTVAVILIRKNDNEVDLPEEQYITEDEGSDKDNVVDGSELFEDEVDAEDSQANEEDSDSQDNTGDSNSQGNTDGSNSQGNTEGSNGQDNTEHSNNASNNSAESKQDQSDNIAEDIFGDGTQGEEEDDTNNNNKVDNKEDNEEEDKDAAEWTPNY